MSASSVGCTGSSYYLSVVSTLDPFLETADTDTSNNAFPPKKEESKFELFERQQFDRPNEMQKAKKKKTDRP